MTFVGIIYESSFQPVRQGRGIWQWTVDRTASIGGLVADWKKERIVAPRWADFEPFAADFLALLADYDEIGRRVHYSHVENLRDDAVHAMTYAHLVARRRSASSHFHLPCAEMG